MDNMMELDIKQLSSISGGKLDEFVIGFLNKCIKEAKENGVTLEELLEGTTDSEMQEYVRAHW